MGAINCMNVYVTFDYELFLGPKTGTVDNCLIKPTNRLMEIAQKHKVHFIFFVDVLYLIKAHEYINTSPIIKEDYNKVYDQLVQLSKKGHDLELHIHPQWYYSMYDTLKHEWCMDFKHYKLSDCSIIDVEDMISKGCSLIQQITGKNPVAFRAGGYSFPIDKRVVDLLKKYNISKDSSVMPGAKAQTDFQVYDYSSIKKSNCYRFENNISVIDPNGFFEEYPITTRYVVRLWKLLKERVILLKHNEILNVIGDGKGVGYLNKSTMKNNRKLFDMIKPAQIRASLDNRSSCWLNYIYWSLKSEKNNIMTIIGHPKNQTMYSFIQLDKFLTKVLRNDKVITFKDQIL